MSVIYSNLFGLRIHITAFKSQSISTKGSETLLYPLTRSETLDLGAHRSHTCRQENTHAVSDRLRNALISASTNLFVLLYVVLRFYTHSY